MTRSLVNQLQAIVGPRGLIDNESDMLPYVTERRERYHGKARLIAFPENTLQVSKLVELCGRSGIGIVPQGGNTGLCGGAIPDSSGQQVVISLRAMNRVREISPDNFSVVVEAGCVLQSVQEQAINAGRLFPLSMASEGSCQIGGNLSTNAGGINVLRYGTARSQVLGLEVVLADGRVLDGLRTLYKDTSGYDLKQMFIGAEGTLGIITAASLRLQALPGEINTALVAISSPTAAVTLLAELRIQFGNSIQAFELIPAIAIQFVVDHVAGARSPFVDEYPWYVLASVETPLPKFESALVDVMESALALDAVIAKSESEAQQLWKVRHSISEAQKPEGASLKHDVSVPVAKIGTFIEAASAAVLQLVPQARMVPFGHVGDGNVHLNVSQPRNSDAGEFLACRAVVADRVFDLVSEYGGSFSAEHGIGVARREQLVRYRSSTEIATMRAIKAALDPSGIMNPGKVL